MVKIQRYADLAGSSFEEDDDGHWVRFEDVEPFIAAAAGELRPVLDLLEKRDVQLNQNQLSQDGRIQKLEEQLVELRRAHEQLVADLKGFGQAMAIMAITLEEAS